MKIQKSQIYVLLKIKNFFKKKNLDLHLLNFSIYSESSGKILINYWSQNLKFFFLILKIIIKETFITTHKKKYKISGINKNKNEKVIVSWAYKKDFSKDGTYKDRYFNITSKDNKKISWFLIYMDEIKPAKMDDNILLFSQKIISKKFNLFKIITKLVANILNSKFDPYIFLIYNSSFFEVSLEVKKAFFNHYDKNIKTIIMPYESQPFQNEIILEAKKKMKKVRTIGYVHSSPCSIPSNFIYNYSSPDKIIVNGKDQMHCFKKYLGWNSKKIELIPSIRLKKKDKKNMGNNIFLPINFNSPKKIILDFKNFFINNPNILTNFNIKNHPACARSKKHLELASNLKKIINLLNKNLKIDKKIKNSSIFIGATGSIIEAIERKIKVIHYCENPYIERYSTNIWKSLVIKKINKHFYTYSTKKYGNILNLGNDNYNLKKRYKLI